MHRLLLIPLALLLGAPTALAAPARPPAAPLVTQAGQPVPRAGKLADGRAFRFVGNVLHVAGKPAPNGTFTLANGLVIKTDRHAVGVEPVILERPRPQAKVKRPGLRTAKGVIPLKGTLKDGRPYEYKGRVVWVAGKVARSAQLALANGIIVKTSGRGVHVDPVILDRPVQRQAR